MSPQEPKPGDRVTEDPTMADEEVLPATSDDLEDEDDIVPGPLDEEDEEEAVDHSPLSNSVPGEDLPL
jgi:hypothetical protein